MNSKNKFFAFIFSLIPGAGETYLGLYKQGLSLMGLLVIIFGVNSVVFSELILAVPLIWFYSFFHVHNLMKLSDEELQLVNDKFIFNLDDGEIDIKSMILKNKKVVGIVLILFGALIFWNSLTNIFVYYDLYVLNSFLSVIPKVAIAILIIYGGIRLIKKNDDFVEKNSIEGKEESVKTIDENDKNDENIVAEEDRLEEVELTEEILPEDEVITENESLKKNEVLTEDKASQEVVEEIKEESGNMDLTKKIREENNSEEENNKNVMENTMEIKLNDLKNK